MKQLGDTHKDTFVLECSNRVLDLNYSTIGLYVANPREDDLPEPLEGYLSYGSDGPLQVSDPATGRYCDFTQEELLEIADFMLGKWQEFRNLVATTPR